MSTSGHLKFQGTNRATFVGTTSNIMFDTTSTSLGIGVTGTDHPSSNLYVTGNAYVSSNIAVGGVLTMGTVNVVARHDLEAVTATGNITPLTVEFTNPTTSLVASGNVEVGGNVVAEYLYGDGSNITGISSNLDQIVNNGNVTSNTVQFSNATTGFVTTANVEVGGELTVSGNVEVGTANLFVDTTNSRVGIGVTSPQTTLHVTAETDTTGTGDAFISGLTGNVGNRKPTECLRLQGKWYSPGSGALLRFTNQHSQGTFPNTGEYNLAGIAGYDHDNNWGGGLAFYTSPGSGSGGDDLTLRMSIDSTGAVNIPGPTTGAVHGSASMLYLLDTCFFKEWSYANYVAPTVKVTFNTSTEIPDGAKAVLAEVFLSRDNLTSGDHQIHVLGKNHLGNQTNWLNGAGQPSTAFSADVDVRQTVELLMPGESDGFTHYFGKWHSSVIIPLENNKIYYSNMGNSSSTGWVYMRVRGYYI
jgi:hypothetical protein